ncbi:MAG: DoxX family protein [Streptosporangiales bacterium]|nr:DoxX family protein [Streptosporangiales bacterium]
MFAAYVAVTILAAAANGSAAFANFVGHEYAKTQADKMRMPQSWRLPLGSLLAAGALGLLAGFVVPALGALAAGGLVLYYIGALGVHLRVRDYQLGPWAMFLSLAVAALAVNLAYHGP